MKYAETFYKTEPENKGGKPGHLENKPRARENNHQAITPVHPIPYQRSAMEPVMLIKLIDEDPDSPALGEAQIAAADDGPENLPTMKAAPATSGMGGFKAPLGGGLRRFFPGRGHPRDGRPT